MLIPGNITKDGKKIGHQAMAGLLNQRLLRATRAFVILGNYDIKNAKPKKYIGDKYFAVEKASNLMALKIHPLKPAFKGS